MNYYHFSYDIIGDEGGDNHVAFDSAMELITKTFSGAVLRHPVKTTLIFSSNLDFEFVRQGVYGWSQAQHVYYALSKIGADINGDPFCRLVSDSVLEVALQKRKGGA